MDKKDLVVHKLMNEHKWILSGVDEDYPTYIVHRCEMCGDIKMEGDNAEYTYCDFQHKYHDEANIETIMERPYCGLCNKPIRELISERLKRELNKELPL